MDNVVYLDYKAKELVNLQSGKKTMIIRGAMGRKIPYGKVNVLDKLYFIENNGDGIIKAKAVVKEVFNSEKLSKEESLKLVDKYKDKLLLNNKLINRFGGKRYLVLITVDDFQDVEPFKIDRSNFNNMDDWLPVGDIEKVKIR